MRFLLCVLFSAVVLNAQASKDKGVYLGGGVALVNVGVVDPFDNEVTFKTGEVILGYKHHPYLGVEVRYGESVQEETIAVRNAVSGLDESVSASIESYVSIYYRAELANEIAKIYFLLGQSAIVTELEFDDSNEPIVETSDTGLSYGIGFGLWLDERMNLNFEIKNLVDTDADSFVSAGLTADYRF